MPRRFNMLSMSVIIVLFISACLSTNLPPIGSIGSFTPEDDELQLWQALRQAEEKVLSPKMVFDDPALEHYLTEIVRRVTPLSYTASGGQPIQVKVRKDPRLNAGAMAHGLIIIHTGLVSRAENESQLAGVLAHEVSHITHRHQVRELRELRNKQTAINVIAFLGSLALAAAAVNSDFDTVQVIRHIEPLLALGLKLTYYAMVSGYSRDLERESDLEAVKIMVSTGYSPLELAQMFQHTLSESTERGPIENFFWGSHPKISERIETVEQEAKKYSINDRTDKVAFERRTAFVRLENARFDAYFGRWRLAMTQVERVLETVPMSRRAPLETLWKAHLYNSASIGARSRGDKQEAERNFTIAVDLYNRVTSASNKTNQAAAYRRLGDLYFAYRDHKATHCESKAAYAKYLELKPDAKDTAAINARIVQLRC